MTVKPLGIYHSSLSTPTDRASMSSDTNSRGGNVRAAWTEVETDEGVFVWTALDTEINAVKAAGKKYALGINSGCTGTPGWVTTAVQNAGGTTFDVFFRPLTYPTPFTIPVGWDATYQTKLTNFAATLAARYGSDPELALVYVTQQTGNGIEGHFNSNSNSDLTDQMPDPATYTGIYAGMTKTQYFTAKFIEGSVSASQIMANAFPNKAIAFEVHNVLGNKDIPEAIMYQLYNDPTLGGRVGVANWWTSWDPVYQADLITVLTNFPGDKYGQIIGKSDQDGDPPGEENRFPTPQHYRDTFAAAKAMGIRYLEPWPFEFNNNTFPDEMASFNRWADGQFGIKRRGLAVRTGIGL